MNWLDAIPALITVVAVLYVLFLWKPCICRYLRDGETCPRHGTKKRARACAPAPAKEDAA